MPKDFVYGTRFTVGGENSDETEYTPFIEHSQSIAGFRVRDMRTNETRYIYLNPSDHGTDEEQKPNVFLYEGTECDPGQDQPHHYYDIDFKAPTSA